jgi:hypothetical protein
VPGPAAGRRKGRGRGRDPGQAGGWCAAARSPRTSGLREALAEPTRHARVVAVPLRRPGGPPMSFDGVPSRSRRAYPAAPPMAVLRTCGALVPRRVCHQVVRRECHVRDVCGRRRRMRVHGGLRRRTGHQLLAIGAPATRRCSAGSGGLGKARGGGLLECPRTSRADFYPDASACLLACI